jgi:hypothetical protein
MNVTVLLSYIIELIVLVDLHIFEALAFHRMPITQSLLSFLKQSFAKIKSEALLYRRPTRIML